MTVDHGESLSFPTKKLRLLRSPWTGLRNPMSLALFVPKRRRGEQAEVAWKQNARWVRQSTLRARRGSSRTRETLPRRDESRADGGADSAADENGQGGAWLVP